MLFITFQAADFADKPEEDIAERKYIEDIFGFECPKGIAWAIPLCDDPIETITRMALTQPNYPHVLMVFETDKYRAINKLEWEKRVQAKDGYSALNEVTLSPETEDSIYLEYYVPYQELADNIKLVFTNGNVQCVSSEKNPFNERFSKEYSKYIEEFLRLVRQHMQYSGDADVMDEGQKQNWMLGIAGDLFFLPEVVLSVTAHFEAIKSGQKEGFDLYFPPQWGEFAFGQIKTFQRIKNSHELECFKGILTAESYKRNYDKMYWFYSFLKEENYPYIEVADHKKTPCPCGSGKKFKYCHGKGLA